MANNDNIPKQVLEATKELIKDEDYVGIVYIGKFENKQVYKAQHKEGLELGFPLIYLFDGKKISRVYGMDALKLELSFQK